MAIMVMDDWGTPVDPSKVEDALKANPGTKVVAFVHAETSTGVQSDAATICALAKSHGALSIVDAVTSLGGTPVLVDEWGAGWRGEIRSNDAVLPCPTGPDGFEQ